MTKDKLLQKLRELWKDVDEMEKANKHGEEIMNNQWLAGRKSMLEELAKWAKEQ